MKRLLSLFLLGCGYLGAAAPARAADLPRLSISNASVAEGNGRFTEIGFTVSASAVSDVDISAKYNTKDLTATAPGDYAAQPAGFVVIKAGQKSARIGLLVVTDTIEEADEQFTVQLFEPKRAVLGNAKGIGTIRDDDYAGTITAGDVSVPELNAGQAVAPISVVFSQPPLHNIEVRYSTTDDSAKASLSDYVAARGTLVVQPGTTGFTVTVPVIGDTAIERDEKFFVRVTAPGYAVAKSLGIVNILNDDVPPPTPTPTPLPPSVALSVGDITVVEGNGDPNTISGDNRTPAQFTITLAKPAANDIQVSYATQAGTATAPADFIAVTGTVLFKTGESTATFTVPVVGDLVEEADKAFTVKISAAGGVTGDPEALGTIRDDDYAGRISIEDAKVTEGTGGTTVVKLPVTLSPAPLHPLDVVFGTHDGSAISIQDYTATSGTLTFPAGTATLSVDVSVTPDTFVESDENFSVEISSNGATFTKFSGLITLTDDDVSIKPSELTGKIVFHSQRDGNYEIYVMNADGSNITRLTNNPATDTFPRLSRDGSQIAFESDRDGLSGIYVMNADGSNVTLISESLDGDFRPAFSPDGTQIAFHSSPGGGPAQIYLTDVANPAPVPIVSATTDVFPSFSPNGNRIVFTTVNLKGNIQIASMRLDGSNRRALTSDSNALLTIYPVFSPDGTKISFALSSSGGGAGSMDHDLQIYSMNPDGSNQTRLTFNAAADSIPFYSPDSSKIAFGSSRTGTTGIYVIRNDGGGEIRLTDGDAPSWSVGSVPAPPSPLLGSAPSGGSA